MKKLNATRCSSILYMYCIKLGLFPQGTHRASWKNVRIEELNLDESEPDSDLVSKKRVAFDLQNRFYDYESLIPLPLKILDNSELTLGDLAKWCYDKQGASSWIPWSDKNEEFAPVVALHPRALFYPTSAESFLNEDCDFWILTGTEDEGPIYGKVAEFAGASLEDKCGLLVDPRFNDLNLFPHLTLHQDTVDIKASIKIQSKHPKPVVYVRGFRNLDSDEAYITYWFFYLENFQPDRFDDKEIQTMLRDDPDVWWTHQGDWEGISLHFADYSDAYPMEVTFSQHTQYETRSWEKTKKQDGHILAVVALGSHATYNDSVSKHQILFWTEKAKIDQDNILYPNSIDSSQSTYELVELAPETQHSWLRFKGRWGKSAGEATMAPTGPMMKTKRGFLLIADKQKLGKDWLSSR